ncbi:MAG: HAD family phosphatase [Phycisphaerales bacterium]
MPTVYDRRALMAAMVGHMDALIFDFDGVIADSEPAHEQAIRETAALEGFEVSHAMYTNEIIGLDDRDTFRLIGRHHGRDFSEAELVALTSKKQDRFLELVDAGEVEAFPGSVKLIREAAQQLPIAVCSGAVCIEIERVLSNLGVHELFPVIVTADDVKAAKPDPTGYSLTARKLGVDTSRCVAIEDTDKGIAAGKAAGLTVVGVCHSLPRERLSQADSVYATIEELNLDRLRELTAV